MFLYRVKYIKYKYLKTNNKINHKCYDNDSIILI